MRELSFAGWYWFSNDDYTPEFSEQNGKWMHFFNDQSYAIEICRRAIQEGVCNSCKCSDLNAQGPRGVICFYIDGDDMPAHRRVIDFMLRNNLVRKTKAGKLYNESFKFDRQTYSGEYGRDFNAEIKLDQFVDLYTGQWIC